MNELKNIEPLEIGKKLCEQAETHEEWLAVVKFGLERFLENQTMLVEVITTEVKRLQERAADDPSLTPYFNEILAELNLQITPTF